MREARGAEMESGWVGMVVSCWIKDFGWQGCRGSENEVSKQETEKKNKEKSINTMSKIDPWNRIRREEN